MKTIELSTLKKDISEMSALYARFRDDDRFVYWFLRAHLTENENQAADAVTGGPGEKSIDGVWLNHESKSVVLIQAKYRRTPTPKSEKPEDVMYFANFATPFTHKADGPFKALIENMHSRVAQLLKEARPYLWRGYRLDMFYVTLGTFSKAVRKDAEASIRHSEHDVSITLLDRAEILRIHQDYTVTRMPPVASLDLELENTSKVRVNTVLERLDKKNGINSWVFSMRGDKVADLYESVGKRLFARNIRGFLGTGKDINKGMTATLQDQADHFFYYNNGITIVCDNGKWLGEGSKKVFRLIRPQIINGQQTTRMLAENIADATHASVLVRVISVPRTPDANSDFEHLVSQIVANTNYQNKIDYADLKANDEMQTRIELALRNLRYAYARKRGSVSEMRAGASKFEFLITKEQLAKAVGACELDPAVMRQGTNQLFQDHYDELFPNDDPQFYLPRYWLFKAMTRAGKGNEQRSWSKWTATRYMWDRLLPILRKDAPARRFWELCQQPQSELSRILQRACDLVFDGVVAYYNDNKGTGSAQQSQVTFFRGVPGRHEEFRQHWKSRAGRVKRFDKLLSELAKELKS